MNNKEEIEKLKDLYKERNEEYEIFGMTGEDVRTDIDIMENIKKLEEQ